LIGLVVVTFLILYFIGTAKWKEMRGYHQVDVAMIEIPAGSAAVARGEHLVTTRLCRECHTDSLAGQSDRAPGLVTLAFPNLTAGAGGVGSTNTDEDWIRAIRHGVGTDGRGLVLMPSAAFNYLNDEDLGAIIAYLKTVPPVNTELPHTNLEPLGRVMLALGQLPPEIVPDADEIDHDGPRPLAPEPGLTQAYGQYLARICIVCHGENLNGRTMREGGEVYIALNLTPGGELRGWSEESFIQTMRTGVAPSGRELNKRMPWKYLGQMTDDELRAVWIYLQSLPPLPQGE
jgi:mono/diheme cytochrome c family protein